MDVHGVHKKKGKKMKTITRQEKRRHLKENYIFYLLGTKTSA